MAFSKPLTEKWGVGQGSSLDDEGKVSATATRTLQGFSLDPVADNELTFKSVLPPVGSTHPRLGTAYILKNVSISQKTPVLYEATLSYNTPPSDDPDNQGYPWNEPAQVDYGTSNETGETEVNADGEEIATVNGESFAVTKDYADQSITIKKAFASYSPVAFYTYINTVNTDQYLGFPAGTLRVTGITASPAKFEDTTYYNVSVNILARKPLAGVDADKAWYWRGPQKGTLIKNTSSSNAKPVHAMEGGKLVTNPVFINEDGTKRKNVNGNMQAIYFLEVKIYEEIDFTGMNLFS